MKPVAFEYCRPETAPEAAALLAEFGVEASLLAGGMSLWPMLNMRLVRPRAVIDLTRVGGLGGIEVGSETVLTGSLVGQAEAMASDELMREVPLLAMALPHVGHVQTRNRGTLGGSVAHGDPSAEIPLALVTLDGTVQLRSRSGERRVRAREFFHGALETERREDELITGLEWPRRVADATYAFDEIAERHGDFAIAAAACRLRIDTDGRLVELSLGLGGVEDHPFAIPLDGFVGEVAMPEFARRVAEAAAELVRPIEDHVASADYRRDLTRLLVGRVLDRAILEAKERR